MLQNEQVHLNMSELSAKHTALNVLRVLSAKKVHRQLARPSPRPDPTGSQEVLATKYQELAVLLAAQHAERKAVSRLHSIDLMSGSTLNCGGCVKPVTRKHRRVPALPEPGSGTSKIVELPSSDSENKDASGLHLSLEQLQPTPPNKKNVSFNSVRFIKGIDECSTSSTDVSDAGLIRRILRSPRKVLLSPRSSPPITTRRRASSSRRRTGKLKRRRGIGKVQNTPRETPRPIERSGSPDERGSAETPREKEFHPTESRLSRSGNPDILSWLKEKNKLLREHKRRERKKERLEKAAEQRAVEEKLRRLAESEDKFNQWVKHKKAESHRQEEIERKARKDAVRRDATKERTGDKLRKQAASGARAQTKKVPTNSRKRTTNKKAVPSPSKEDASDSQKRVGEETRHRLVGNPEAERQRKESDKRRRRPPLREPPAESSTRSDPKARADTQPAGKASTVNPQSEDGGKTSPDGRKTRPSCNPFRGMRYDDWLRQKQADQRKQAKFANTQEACDPELDDLVPLLARRRIERIKVQATRVDSGLRRSRESTKPERPRTPNGVRPYTWKKPTSFSDGKQTSPLQPSPPKTKNSDKSQMAPPTPMPDVVNFARPELQGCESSEQFPCQSPKTKDTNQLTNQSEARTSQFRDYVANRNDHSVNGKQLQKDQTQASEADVIFLTETKH